MSKKPKTLWSWTLTGKQECVSRRPLLSGNSVYFSQTYRKADFYESRLVRVDRDTGAELWEQLAPHVAGTPVVGHDGTIFWSRWDGIVLALSPTGELLWESSATHRNLRDPILAGGALVVCECMGQSERVRSLEPGTGQTLWCVNLCDEFGFNPSDFVVGQHNIVVLADRGTFDEREHSLFALRIKDGALAWRKHFTAGVFPGSPFLWSGAVNLACDGTIQEIDPETGDTVGAIETPGRIGMGGRPLAQATRLITTLNSEEMHFVAVYDDGDPPRWAWQQPVPEPVAALPEPMGSTLGLLGERGLVSVLDSSSGELRGQFVHARNRDGAGGLAYHDGRLCVAHGRRVACYAVGT